MTKTSKACSIMSHFKTNGKLSKKCGRQLARTNCRINRIALQINQVQFKLNHRRRIKIVVWVQLSLKKVARISMRTWQMLTYRRNNIQETVVQERSMRLVMSIIITNLVQMDKLKILNWRAKQKTNTKIMIKGIKLQIKR